MWKLWVCIFNCSLLVPVEQRAGIVHSSNLSGLSYGIIERSKLVSAAGACGVIPDCLCYVIETAVFFIHVHIFQRLYWSTVSFYLFIFGMVEVE